MDGLPVMRAAQARKLVHVTPSREPDWLAFGEYSPRERELHRPVARARGNHAALATFADKARQTGKGGNGGAGLGVLAAFTDETDGEFGVLRPNRKVDARFFAEPDRALVKLVVKQPVKTSAWALGARRDVFTVGRHRDDSKSGVEVGRREK